MKLTKELISVKEYCNKYKITDAAVRKQIKNNKVISLVYEDITYIVIENNDKEKLKNNIKLKNQKLKTLEQEKYFYDNQKETIIKLENKIEKLEEELKEERKLLLIETQEQKKLLKEMVGHYTDNRLEYKG